MKRETEKMKSLVAVFATTIIAASVYGQKPNIEWANIPAGTFTMGSPTTEVNRQADETQHEVTLSAFKMSKYVLS
jgi:formylglycine-generating enzyme required for sulfatase activity